MVGHPGGVFGPLGRERVVCVRDIFILNEIWTQDKIAYYDRHFACLKYVTCQSVPVLDRNYKQHILSPATEQLNFMSYLWKGE
jgi:hypothetical protein